MQLVQQTKNQLKTFPPHIRVTHIYINTFNIYIFPFNYVNCAFIYYVYIILFSDYQSIYFSSSKYQHKFTSFENIAANN